VLSATSWAAADLMSNDLPNLGKPLKPPAHGPVEVAFVGGPETVLIDVAGPWEAFNDAMLPFHTYIVAQRLDAVDLGGIKARADYTFENAPLPHVIVVPATKASPESIAWIMRTSSRADITMSICTGAFVLAEAGLLWNGRFIVLMWRIRGRKEFESAATEFGASQLNIKAEVRMAARPA
jgi:transcriptional regulator GlxA family with amidase domain